MAAMKLSRDFGHILNCSRSRCPCIKSGTGTQVTSGKGLWFTEETGSGAPNSQLMLGVPPTMPHSLPKPLEVDLPSQQGILRPTGSREEKSNIQL